MTGFGTNIPGFSSGASQTINAVDYDGVAYQSRGSDLTGNADSSKGIVSFWWNAAFSAVSRYILAGTSGYGVFLQTDNRPRILLNNAAGVPFSMACPTIPSAATWHHCVAAWDFTTTTTAQLYVNDVDAKSIVSDPGIPLIIDYTQANHYLGAFGGTPSFDGCLAELYFAPGQYLDLTDSANRLKFRTAAGKPAALGDFGQAPTGVRPKGDWRNSAERFHLNLGDGGNYIPTGTLGVCSSSPA